MKSLSPLAISLNLECFFSVSALVVRFVLKASMPTGRCSIVFFFSNDKVLWYHRIMAPVIFAAVLL